MGARPIELFDRGAEKRFLGPAEVTGLGQTVITVRLPSGESVDATMALASPYAPALNDILLTFGDDESGYYIIGVIEGHGNTKLSFHGDVRIHAEEGSLTLSADRGVKLRGPLVEVIGDKLSVVAKDAIQKFSTLHQRVRDMLSTHAGEQQSIVEGTSLERARKVSILAEETASVNGKQILLG